MRPKSAGSPVGAVTPSSATRSVAWYPGHTRFSVMPSGARSAAAVFAHAHRPARAVFEAARSGIGCFTALEVISTIRPPPVSRIGPSAARTSRMDASRFASTAARSWSSVTSRARARGGPPAFATRMSSLPNRSTVRATRSSGTAGSATSAGIARVSGPSASAASARRTSSRAQIATRHPSAARAAALA